MVINNDKQKAIFIHIPKCGGISIEHTLYDALSPTDVLFDDMKVIQAKPNYERYENLSPHSFLPDYRRYYGTEGIKDFFVFSFVRNPWRRMVSHYEYLVIDINWHKKVGDNDKLSFSEFLQVYESDIIPWTVLNYDQYLYDHRSVINFVGKLENIDEDMKKIGEKINLDLSNVLHMNKTKEKIKLYSDWKDYYNPWAKDKVYQMWKKDIEKYGYEFEE